MSQYELLRTALFNLMAKDFPCAVTQNPSFNLHLVFTELSGKALPVKIAFMIHWESTCNSADLLWHIKTAGKLSRDQAVVFAVIDDQLSLEESAKAIYRIVAGQANRIESNEVAVFRVRAVKDEHKRTVAEEAYDDPHRYFRQLRLREREQAGKNRRRGQLGKNREGKRVVKHGNESYLLVDGSFDRRRWHRRLDRRNPNNRLVTFLPKAAPDGMIIATQVRPARLYLH